MKPDFVRYVVYYFDKTKLNYAAECFCSGQFEDAVTFANSLLGDDRYSDVYIVSRSEYFFDRPRSLVEFHEDCFDKEVQ